ncbi:MAG: serine acetyltransferase [Chitinophagaceae bacterium]
MEVENFVEYLFSKTYKSVFEKKKYSELILKAYRLTELDYLYHHPNKENLFGHIKSNNGWLVTFLYRLGNVIFKENSQDMLLTEIHWIMKEVCSCEIYYSIDIGEGLYVRHGAGAVIGSRCVIGKGLIIHQNCTIGHKVFMGNGPSIGNDVEMGAGSKILGEISIGNKVIVAANAVVLNNISENSIVAGIPAIHKKVNTR